MNKLLALGLLLAAADVWIGPDFSLYVWDDA